MKTPTVLASAVTVLTLIGGPAMAQAPGTPPRPAPSPAAPAAPEKEKEVEGTVKKVDATKKSVQVSSGLLGLFGATLEVDDSTKINVDGKDGSIADIREGARVKASYESRDGRNVAKSIDVMRAEEGTAGAPARPGTPSGGGSPSATTPGASSPGAGQSGAPPKTQ
jgi:hypothetical protein